MDARSLPTPPKIKKFNLLSGVWRKLKCCWNIISIPAAWVLILLSVSSSGIHMRGIILMNTSHQLFLLPCTPLFPLACLPLFSPLLSLASGNVRVCKSWVQSVIFGCGGGPQLSLGLQGLLLSLNHVTWKTAECVRVSFFLCVCVCVYLNTKWKMVHPPHLRVSAFLLYKSVSFCCPLYILPLIVNLTCVCVFLYVPPSACLSQWYVIAAACRTWTGWTVCVASWTSRRRRTAAAFRGDTSYSIHREMLCCGIWTTLRCSTHTCVTHACTNNKRKWNWPIEAA